jgi:phenylacetate-coenzyme A ligase PaaK-like adenylate-forming protein
MGVLETVCFASRVLYRSRLSRSAPAKVARLQELRLRRLLLNAVERSRFYRDKFRGIDVARCRIEDLPITTKAEVMERFDDLVTDPEVRRSDLERFMENSENVGKLFLGRYPVCHTSGSLGQSLLIVQNPLTIELMFGFQMTRGNAECKTGLIEAVRRVARPGHVMVLVNRQGFYPSTCIFHHIPTALSPFVRFEFVAESDPQLEEKVRRFKPLALAGAPSSLDVLALRADRLDLSKLRQVTSHSETLTASARARLEQAFRVPVINNYSSGECLFLTNGCRNGKGMHLNADWAILENVDGENRGVAAGVAGTKTLLTNLANTIQPFIRYEVGDRVVMAEPDSDCGCGNRLPRIERVDGRAADFFWVRVADDYRALPTPPFQHSLEYFRTIREWQAVQIGRNRIVVRLERLAGTDIDLEQLRVRLGEHLQSAGVADQLDLEFEFVDRLDWDRRTGKFRRMVSFVGPPEDLSTDQPRGVLVAPNDDEPPDPSSGLIAAGNTQPPLGGSRTVSTRRHSSTGR